MLTREQEHVKSLQSLIQTMKENSEDAVKIQILNDALDNGFRFEPGEMYTLMGFSSAAVIESFLQHELCTVKHLINIFNHVCYSDMDELCLLIACMQNAKFPADQKEYTAHGGKLFANICSRLIYKDRDDSGIAFIRYIFENHPKLITYSDLQFFVPELMTRYKHEADLEKLLLLVCHHPDYWYMAIHDDGVTSEGKIPQYPFYHAATKSYKNVFNYFYFHESISDEVKVNAVELAKKDSHLMKDVANHRFKSIHEKHMLAFYMAVMCGDNPLLLSDVIFLIFKMWMKAVSVESCLASIEEKSFKPVIYKKNPMSLFQRPSVPHSWLITRARCGIEKYQWATRKGASTKRGKHRACFLGIILGNHLVSSDCKIFAVYSVLNEITSWGGKSRIRDFLNKEIGQYIEAINKIAEDYAKEKNLDLEKLKNNFVSRIHDESIPHLAESELIEKIGKGTGMNLKRGQV